MIQDPGAGPRESPEPQPSVKFDGIPYDLHRPPVPAPIPPGSPTIAPMDLDPETPLDMTVRRKDSDRQPPSTATLPVSNEQNYPIGTNSGGSTNDASLNFNTRPSVITKAPPPPIKKRISSMHSNGEIVIKGDNLSPVNCDVFIEEHFRRSLGNTYASIYGNNHNQQKNSGSDTRNSSTSSSSSISSSCSGNNNSIVLSNSSSLSSSSGIGSVASSSTSSNSSNSSTSSLIGNSVNFSAVSSNLGSISPIIRHNNVVTPPVEISPLLRVKVDPTLVKQQHVLSEPRVQSESPMVQVKADSEEEVDNHFAKALGNDTWKMIQEKKMNL